MLGGLNKKDYMESVQNKVWHMGLFSRYLVLLLLLWSFCYWSEPFPQRNKGESCSLSVPGAGVWGEGPCHAGAGEQPREGNKHCFSHTSCWRGVARCSRNDTLAQSALPFVLCPVWSLKLVTKGAILHQAGQIFCKTDGIHM